MSTSSVASEEARVAELKKHGLERDLSLRLFNTAATVGPLVTGLIPVVLGVWKV